MIFKVQGAIRLSLPGPLFEENMAKAGWKKGKKLDQIDSGLMSLKSSPSETKAFINPEMDTESKDVYSRKQKLDPLTEYLGCTRYYSQMRWQWFKYNSYGIMRPLEVSRYYDEKKLAIDIAPSDRDMVALKMKLLMSHGIKYIVLDSPHDVKNLSVEAS